MCKNAPHVVQILENLDGNGRTTRGGLDALIRFKKKKKKKRKRKTVDIKAANSFPLWAQRLAG